VYFYADAYNGTIWGVQRDGATWLNQQLAQLPYFITSLGEDEAGRLYGVDYISGQLFEIEDSGQVIAPAFEPAGTDSYTDRIVVRCLSPTRSSAIPPTGWILAWRMRSSLRAEAL